MNLQTQIGLTKSELASTLLIFALIVVAVLSSRLIRLTSNYAIEFEQETELIFEEPANLKQLQTKLEEQNVGINIEEMNWAARILGWRNMQRGRYVFEGNHSYNGFLSKMARGIQDPVSVPISPGITPERMAFILSEKLNFSQDDFISALNDSAYLAEKGMSSEELFGRMLPDTYLIYWTIRPLDLIGRVNNEFENSFTQEFKDKAEELDLSINEVVTLASIVEWEAKFPEEKAKISGLYWNRLNRGMRLQADPTVNFAVGERRRLLFEDYQIDHPYNTYVIRGLPPGPITNSSLSTIEATLFPEEHDYLYMVANPEGGHVFTKTFIEHQAESEKWRIWLREQYRIKRQREAAEQQLNEKETR
ncbi:MAG: endolytic transglycosylase MltG [Gracilimonas sp.]